MTSSPTKTTSNPLHSFQSQHIFTLRAFKNSQLIKYPKLTELYFNPKNHIYLDPKFFTKVCQGLKTLKSLTVLNLNFTESMKLDDQSLYELSLALRQLHGLKVLHLNFKRNRSITGEGIARLLKTIKNNRYLSEVYLDFSSCGRVKFDYLESIYESIGCMKLLTSFHLKHPDIPYLTHPYGRELGQDMTNCLSQLRRLNYMRDFSIDFKMLGDLLNCDIVALSRSIHRMVRLSKVSLSFEGTRDVSETSLEKLALSLRSLKKLSKLHLNCVRLLFFEPRGKMFDIISKAFESSPTLSDLALDLGENDDAKSDHVHNLLVALQTLSNLSKLSLNFNSCKDLDNKLLKFLAEGIASLTSLTLLKLNFAQCPLINGEGLVELSPALKNLTSLQVFDIDFSKQQSLRSGLVPFFEALSHLTNLSTIALNFSQCKEIQDEDVKLMAETLKKFKSLKSLSLNISSSQITNAGLKDLASCLGSLDSLEILKFNVFGCKNLSIEGADFLTSQLSKIKSLKQKNLLLPSQPSSASTSSQGSTCSIF